MLQVKEKFNFNTANNLLIILILGFSLTFLQKSRLNEFKNQHDFLSKAEVEKQIEQETIKLDTLKKIPDFGYKNLYADWIFLNFVQYFGDDTARELSNYSLSPDYFEIILGRDPRFLDAYFFLSTSTSFYAANPEKSINLMNEKLPLLSPKVP